MLLPFNVERPTRRVPICTYSLMAANIFIYLLTVVVANAQLYSERDTHRQQLKALVQMKMYEMQQAERDTQPAAAPYNDSSSEPQPDNQSFAFGSFLKRTSQNQISDLPQGEQPGSDLPGANRGRSGASDYGYDNFQVAAPTAETIELARVLKAVETGKKVTKDEIVQARTFVWDQQHDRDLFVLEPHPTTLAWVAYWVGAPTALGFFMSMFVHGGLEHILGNMLFLWVFGRALEDALGPIIYTLAYFVCGIAATLLFHIATMQFTPAQAMIPSMGASGAIAGLLGLFAPRFYQTPIKVFYTKWITEFLFLSGGTIFLMAATIIGFMLSNFVGSEGYTLGALVALAGLIMYGEDTLWGEWKVKAAWGIAAYFIWNDVIGLMIENATGSGGGVAHWAHIGGFVCGVVYAFLCGLTGEAKTEYITDEAEASLEQNHGTNAMQSAQQLLAMKPNDPQAHRLMARSLDAKSKGAQSEEAADAWEKTIEKYLQAGDRDGAAKTYLEATTYHRGFILMPRTQFLLGNHLARLGDHVGAAETLVKIPYTFPDAPEGELSLLRSAQLYAQHLGNPMLAHQLLTTMLERYPDTEWKAQVESGLKNTQATKPSAAQGKL